MAIHHMRHLNVPNSFVENTLEVALGESRALEVFVCANLLCANQRLLVRHRLHALLSQRLESCTVFSQIELCADKNDGNIRGMVIDLGIPLCYQSVGSPWCIRGTRKQLTLALTLSNDGGLTMEKQMRKTSV